LKTDGSVNQEVLDTVAVFPRSGQRMALLYPILFAQGTWKTSSETPSSCQNRLQNATLFLDGFSEKPRRSSFEKLCLHLCHHHHSQHCSWTPSRLNKAYLFNKSFPP